MQSFKILKYVCYNAINFIKKSCNNTFNIVALHYIFLNIPKL